MMTPLDRRFCVAPMLDWTDRHMRYFLRLITRHALLYTEMVTTGAIIHGDARRHLLFHESEHPVALQLGGSEPDEMARCARLGADYGYDEININLGCPSERVQRGAFGACLMLEPELVAECVTAMKQAAGDVPVTVKNRIGVNANDSYEELIRFVDIISGAGCNTFIIHARKAWLKGLSPKENRDIPPLMYDLVYQLKRDFPHLEMILNGGITTMQQCGEHLQHVDGVMVGREAYHNPYMLVDVDSAIYGDDASTVPSRHEVLRSFMDYMDDRLRDGVPLKHMTRHILGLFHGVKGAKGWRRYLSENAFKPGAGIEVVMEAEKFTES